MKLKIASFNIRCANDPNGHSIPERAPRLKSSLEPHEPDIIGFQECTPQWLPIIEADYGEKYEIFNRFRAERERESSPMLWRKDRFRCIKTGYFWLSDTPEEESKGWDEVYDCYRMCVWALLEEKSSGKAFLFMNTHFGFGDAGQVKSVELIKKYKSQITDAPAFLIGDFNADPTMPAYKKLCELFTDVNTATVNDMRATWHNYGKNSSDELKYHIDHCFIDGKIKPLSYKMITDTFDGKYPSDHYGFIAKIEI